MFHRSRVYEQNSEVNRSNVSHTHKKPTDLQILLGESPYRSKSTGTGPNRDSYAQQSLNSARHIYTRGYSRRVKRDDQEVVNVQKTYEELLKENEQLKAQLISMTKLQSNGYLSFDPSITENLAVENKTYRKENERLQNLTLKQTKQIKMLQQEVLELQVANDTMQNQLRNNAYIYKETNAKLQDQQVLIIQLKEQLLQQDEQIQALKRLHDSRLDQSKSKDYEELQQLQNENTLLQSKISELQKEILQKEQIIFEQENLIQQLKNDLNEKSLVEVNKKVTTTDFQIIANQGKLDDEEHPSQEENNIKNDGNLNHENLNIKNDYETIKEALDKENESKKEESSVNSYECIANNMKLDNNSHQSDEDKLNNYGNQENYEEKEQNDTHSDNKLNSYDLINNMMQ